MAHISPLALLRSQGFAGGSQHQLQCPISSAAIKYTLVLPPIANPSSRWLPGGPAESSSAENSARLVSSILYEHTAHHRHTSNGLEMLILVSFGC